MSAYRSYYDYRKNYETRSTNTSNSSSSNKNAPTKTVIPKPEEEKASKYTTSYRRFPQPSTVSTPATESSSESKISKEMRAKYGPEGYKPKTDPPITYNNKKFDSTPRYSLTAPNTTNLPRSRGASPVTGPKTESALYSTYTPYHKAGFSTTNTNTLSKDKTSTSRRGSREDLTRVGTVTASLKPGISRYRTTSTSSTRGSREDLSRIGSSTRGTSLTRRDSLTTKSIPSTASSLSRRNSREELNKIGSTPMRYSGSTSLNRYSLTTPKTDNKLYTTSRRSPVPTNITPTYSSSHNSRSASQELSTLLPTTKTTKENDTHKQNDSQLTNEKNDVTDETITVTVMTRGTSPTPPTQSTITRTTKRSDIARQIQRDITRPKLKPEMIDKEVQSDRTDDTARYSRYGGSTRSSSSTSSWNSFLDIKYTSPSNSYSKYTSPRNSTQSTSSVQSKNEEKPAAIKKEKSDSSIKSTKTKSTSSSIPSSAKSPSERVSPTKLPPTVPKTTSSSNCSKNHLSTSQHSLEQINKDFRKSVLNMNQFSKQKSRSKSSIASSSDSEASSKSNLNKKPANNKIKDMKSPSRSRSTSTDSTTSSLNIKGSNKSKSENLDPDSTSITEPSKSESRTSQGVSELITDDPFKFKIKPVDSGEIAWWLQKTPSDGANNISTQTNSSSKQKYSIKPIESGERAWWLTSDTENENGKHEEKKSINDSTSNITNTNYKSFSTSDKNKLKLKPIRLIESGERAWWLNSEGDTKSKSQVNSSDKDFWAQINSTTEENNNNIMGLQENYRRQQSSEDEDDSSSDELENYVINSQGITEPLGDRLSPDGIEATCEDEIYSRARRIATQFISKHTNIDDFLNTEPPRENYRNSSNSSSGGAVGGGGVKVLSLFFFRAVISALWTPSTKKIKKELEDYNLKVAFVSKNKIKEVLGNPKDKKKAKLNFYL